jgi:hypothetical protein
MTEPATRDLRAAISELADQTLDAVALARSKSKQEVVRDVLDQWAAQVVHESTLVQRMTRGHGSGRSEAE